MARYLLILITLCLGITSHAQFSPEEEEYIDSLESIITTHQSDVDVASAYINLSELLYFVYPDTLEPLCLKALDLADKNLAKNNLNKEDIEIFNRVKGNAYNNIGYVYDVQGELYKALEYYFLSLKIREKIKDSVGISTTLNNIGMVYDLQGNKEEAVKIYQRSIGIQRATDDAEGLAYSYMNLGVIYSDLNDYQEARAYYDSSVYMHQIANDPRGLGSAYVGQGNINYFLGNYKESIESYTNALKIFDEFANQQGRTECYYGLGELYLKQGKVNLASEYGQKSYNIAEELGHPFLLRNASRLLMEVYRKQGNYPKALEMYDTYVLMKDSVRNETNEQLIVRKELNYQHEKQQFADSLRNAKILAISQMEVDKGKVELANEKMQNYLLYGGLVVVGLFLFFFINRLKTSQRQKAEIQQQKKIVEEQRDEVSRQKEIIEEAHKEITDSIAYAKRIQSAILPPPKLVKAYLNKSFILYKPKDIVAGDFYWLEHTDNKVLCCV